jgi:Sulphur transport
MTVVGGTLGVWIEEKTFRTPPASPIGFTILARPGTAAIALLAVVALWCVIGLIARSSEAGSRRWARLAPMVMGLTGGALYLIDGGWAYTLDVGRLVSAPAPGEIPEDALLVITAVTAAGAVAAAWTSGNFRPRLDIAVLPHRLGGGTLMGFGAPLVPGGNAVLILHGIPAFSPHAMPDYLAFCLAITVMLQISGRLRTLARFPVMLHRSAHKAQTRRVESRPAWFSRARPGQTRPALTSDRLDRRRAQAWMLRQ